ncbi:hypothetical protein DID78_01255 [Candidatus Marinamargulisbacteria bacterium SCGC AG-343-D04]|nr:hypothetical protein DID78_01255 [Candidatus Marinamargulisbacteria bacterium SCGC AG-343-D04]
MKRCFFVVFFFSIYFLSSGLVAAIEDECVVVAHGLGRTSRSMAKMATVLEKEGYVVYNVNYPSRKYTIDVLVSDYIEPAVQLCSKSETIHFVTHSLGGILVRYYLNERSLEKLGHVVMIAPPNKGSELVDKLGNVFFYRWWLGPAFMQLSTDESSVPNRLPVPHYSLGVIAGTKSLNPFFSLMIPGDNDGKVSLKSAEIQGKDFMTVHASHSWIMNDQDVLDQTVFFLKNGGFKEVVK